MGWGRRRQTNTVPVNYTPRAVIATHHPYPNEHAPSLGVTGWKPLNPAASVNAQIGAYAGTMLTQTPGMLPGLQLKCGVEGLRSRWYYPPAGGSGLPLGSVQLTQRGANVTPAQLSGQRFTGLIGPLSARAAMARVTAAQVRQSGTQMMDWARSLSGTPVGSAPGAGGS